MEEQVNALNWFEIPVQDFERAVGFYQNLLQTNLFIMNMNNIRMGFFPSANGGVGGSICCGEGLEPSLTGTCIFLNAGTGIDQMLKRAEHSGGEILIPKTFVSQEIGHIAYVKDSEGNKIGLHSTN